MARTGILRVTMTHVSRLFNSGLKLKLWAAGADRSPMCAIHARLPSIEQKYFQLPIECVVGKFGDCPAKLLSAGILSALEFSNPASKNFISRFFLSDRSCHQSSSGLIKKNRINYHKYLKIRRLPLQNVVKQIKSYLLNLLICQSSKK